MTYNEIITKENPYGIKTPTSVDEFRENLQKYYVTIPRNYDRKKYPNRQEVPFEFVDLYVQEGEIPLMDIESFDDIINYPHRRRFESESPHIFPMITEIKPLDDYMGETYQCFSSVGYFKDESHFKLWDKVEDYMEKGNPLWFTLDNIHLREFYVMTLGRFTGFEEQNKMYQEVEDIPEDYLREQWTKVLKIDSN